MAYTYYSTFNDNKHTSRAWNTTRVRTRNPLIRRTIRFFSFKHDGIARMMDRVPPGAVVLDCGCGNGAYAQWVRTGYPVRLVTLDISFPALRTIQQSQEGVDPVCADACALPFKAGVFDAQYTVDTLGHISTRSRVLDELNRTCIPGASLFFHSECGDYRHQWPSGMLIQKTGNDCIAQLDGHVCLQNAHELYTEFARRFHVDAFFSPAGIVGWLLGYPEKYSICFARAGCGLLAALTSCFAIVKRVPGAGLLLRIVNVCTNRIELYFGIQGGGSCFAQCRSPRSRETAHT